MYQKSLVLIKPDGVKRRIVGRILSRFEDAGFKIHAIDLVIPSKELAQQHYIEHEDKYYFDGIVDYLSSSAVVSMVLGGIDCIGRIRTMVGPTEPAKAAPGTIRGDFAHISFDKHYLLYNVIHASANLEDASREVKLWFGDDLAEYDDCSDDFTVPGTND